MDDVDAVGVDENVPKHVEAVLADVFAEREVEAGWIGLDFLDALGSLRDFVLNGGKRIRPTFAWWGWRGAGGDPDSPEAGAVLSAISALELVQAGALVHDDVMDASAVRRGSPTMHVAFTERHHRAGWLGPAGRFGQSAAILLGDVALAWADDLFHGAGLSPAVHERALLPWRAMRTEVLAGQYVDVLTQAGGDSSAEAALRVSRLKTAAYTVERPLHLGAALAGAGPELTAAYRAYGADVGIAFQLRDDLLGVFGDPSVTGKPAGDDLREGKRTLLVSLGISRAESAGRARSADALRGYLGNPGLTPADVDQAREILVSVGAVTEIEERIEDLTESGLAALDTADIAAPARTHLAGLAIRATRRDR